LLVLPCLEDYFEEIVHQIAAHPLNNHELIAPSINTGYAFSKLNEKFLVCLHFTEHSAGPNFNSHESNRFHGIKQAGDIL
jgi:hypothetical protein